MGKTLTCNQILCISNEGAMTDHHTFRLAGSACGIENICYSVGRLTQAATDFLEQGIRHTMFQRGRHASGEMNGHVGDKEVNVLRRTETDHFMRTEIVRTTFHLLPQLGISQILIPTDYSDLIRISDGVLSQIIN